MDEIARGINPSFEGIWDRSTLNLAMRQRNAMLGSLKHAKHGKAFFIVGAPTSAERMWWAMKLGQGSEASAGAEIVSMDVPPEECRRRAIARGSDPKDVDTYLRSASFVWTAPKPARKKLGIDADGYPITSEGES